jgi:DNA-binding LytR/AlgR family response regulator
VAKLKKEKLKKSIFVRKHKNYLNSKQISQFEAKENLWCLGSKREKNNPKISLSRGSLLQIVKLLKD